MLVLLNVVGRAMDIGDDNFNRSCTRDILN